MTIVAAFQTRLLRHGDGPDEMRCVHGESGLDLNWGSHLMDLMKTRVLTAWDEVLRQSPEA